MNRTAITSMSICAVLSAFVLGAYLRPSGSPPANASRIELATSGLGPLGQTNRRTLTLTGTATLDVVPDVLDVAIELQTNLATTSRAAVRDLERRRAKLLAALEAAKVPRDQTSLSTVHLSPDWDGTPRRIFGYTATLSVTVTLKDFDRAAAVLDAAAAAGAGRLQTSFRSTKMPELKKRVRAMALGAAKDKAAQIRETLDLDSIDVQSVNESASGRGWGYWYQSPWQANAVALANPAQVSSGGFAPEIQPLTLTVNITYVIGD